MTIMDFDTRINRTYSVYFVEAPTAPDSPIKIGFAINPNRRIKEIQTCSPVKVVLLGIIDGDAETELAFHNAFADYRLHNEWFSGAIKSDVLAILETANKRRSHSSSSDSQTFSDRIQAHGD